MCVYRPYRNSRWCRRRWANLSIGSPGNAWKNLTVNIIDGKIRNILKISPESTEECWNMCRNRELGPIPQAIEAQLLEHRPTTWFAKKSLRIQWYDDNYFHVNVKHDSMNTLEFRHWKIEQKHMRISVMSGERVMNWQTCLSCCEIGQMITDENEKH